MTPPSEEPNLKMISCPNLDCKDFRKSGMGNISFVSEKETTGGITREFKCHTCGETFDKCIDLERDFKGKMKVVLESFKSPDLARLSILGVLIGLIGGLGAFLFHYLILAFKYIFFGATDTGTFLDTVLALPWYQRLLIPALGGLIIGPIITYFVREARGHGVPEVMEGVALRGGKIRARVAPLKALMSAICIGSGGSAGREGPIVQIGASFGSSLGQFLDLEPDRIKTLLAAGAAAGIAGTFNAPLAGVVFSMEVILRDIKKESFAPIVIAAVVGTSFANLLFGGRGPIFYIPSINIGPWDVLFLIGIGFAAAGVGLLFSNSLYKVEHLFEKIPFPEAIRPALGGLMLGALALSIPQVQATGYPVMTAALWNELPFYLVLILMFGKILSTCLSLGSGGSGGIFAPSLFIGSMMGSTYGKVVDFIAPNLTAGPSTYAVVGMAAVFAAASHAPLTAIVILFEMTGDPGVIILLMFPCIICTVIASHVQHRNIYTTKLLNRGIDIEAAEEKQKLRSIPVKNVMDTDLMRLVIYKKDTFKHANKKFTKTHHTQLPVLDNDTGEFMGMINYFDVLNRREELDRLVDFISPPMATVTEDDDLYHAFELLGNIEVEFIPVVDKENPDKLVGGISRRDILEEYYWITE